MTNTFEDLKIREISHCHDVRCLALAAACPLLLYAGFKSISRSAPIGITSACDYMCVPCCVCVWMPEGDFLSQSVVMEAAAAFH